MKKTVFNASVTAAALAAGVCSFATMPEGRALSKQEKIVSRGLEVEICKGCKSDKSCIKPQKIPTLINKGAFVVICTDQDSSTKTDWSATEQVTHSTPKYNCQGTWYKCIQKPDGTWAWIVTGTGDDVRCGAWGWSECNSAEGGWGTNLDGGIIDGRADYIKNCNKVKPGTHKE